MAKIDLISKDWCDLVFEGRNKAYGAYYLRSKQGALQFKAIITVLAFCAAVIGIPALVSVATSGSGEIEEGTEVTQLSRLEEAKVKEENVVKRFEEQPQEVQLIKTSVKFTAPVIAKDEQVTKDDELQTQEQLTDAKGIFAKATVQGNDDERGKSIDDIKEVITSEKPVEEKVYDVVEQMPQFPGGEAALLQYIGSHINYPAIALEQEVQGMVVLRFVVTETGQVGEVKVIRSLEKHCDNEAIRVIKSLPRFTPGKQQGRSVPVWYTCPVRFTIRN